MANPLLRTLFLILSITAVAAVPTTATNAVDSTVPITNAVDSTIPITNDVDSSIPITNDVDVNSNIPTTNSAATAVYTTGTKYSISPQELDTLLRVLRDRGYPLFSNAIHTSDVQFQILNSHATLTEATSAAEEEATPAFTLFAPRDHFLYTLDMASDADAYVAALRSHVIPSHRLTIAELRNLTSPYLDTLLPHYSILVGKSNSDDVLVTVDGVRISDPNLYLGSRFVVHGLDGILLTGFNMYEDTIGEMGKGFFAPAKEEHFAPKSGRQNEAAELPEAKNGGLARVTRKQRKLQHRRIWRSNYGVRRSNDEGRGEDDF